MHACYLIESFMWRVSNWVSIEDICLNTGLTYKTLQYKSLKRYFDKCLWTKIQDERYI